MKALLVSRYPRVDTPPWKRHVAARLLESGVGVTLLYSQSTLVDHARAGIRDQGAGVLKRYLALRRPSEPATTETQSLASWAREREIPVIRSRQLRDSVTTVQRVNPDLVVLLGADIVPASLLQVPRLGTINAHYGLLPGFRGMNVTEWSVFCGAPVGVTVHLVDPGIDTGPILRREAIFLEAGETFMSLRRKHQDVAARLIVQSALELRDGTATPTVQAPASGRQYYRMHPALRRVAEARLRAQALR